MDLGVFMYKFYKNDLPVGFNNYFKKRSDIHDYPTRQVKIIWLYHLIRNPFLIMLFELVDPTFGTHYPKKIQKLLNNSETS